MPESPTKRRRTSKRPLTMNARSMTVTWPKDVIPVEIFSLIISYLSRSTVQNMRLVCQEFEEKVAHDLFQTVVIPFSSEIYGIARESAAGTGQPNHNTIDTVQDSPPIMLQDMGMRVFQGFGRHIHKFGMSFELDYQLLTKPPQKSDQEAITTFWGIYRWPFKGYNRYSQLEGLEQTADETRTMAKALRFISNAKELGLSIDGGLGWLSGPDVNTKMQAADAKAVVFGESRFRPEEKARQSVPSSSLRARPPSPFGVGHRPATSLTPASNGEIGDDASLPAFIRMLREAGYEGSDLAQSVRTLMESEGVFQTSQADLNPSFTSTGTNPELLENGSMDDYLRSLGYEGTRLERMKTALTHAIVDRTDLVSSDAINYHPLKPNDLTNAQKEMLLETEWAQRAFMQSYAIAIIDNPATFQGIESLSIARLPSRHLAILRRGDFWDSLSQLRKISLAIIPDWREVVKLPTSWVDDVRVPPSQAIWGVHYLLKDHVAPRKSIKTLHFEWLCGGEDSSGIFTRNQLLLAAPLVPQAMDMVTRTNLPAAVLNLPYIENLSLKNCWSSPHILSRFVKTLKKEALKSLILHSISLSAPTPRNAQPGPVNVNMQHQQQHMMQHAIANFQAQAFPNVAQMQGQGGVAPAFAVPFVVPPAALLQQQAGTLQPPPQTVTNIGLSVQSAINIWLEQPRIGSWAHVIDQISPGETLASLRNLRDLGPPPPVPEQTKLKKIVFHSCGYIRLLLDFDQTMLDPPVPLPADTHAITKRRSDIEQYMMKPQDHALGSIINYIHEDEAKTLENAWSLRMGWGKTGKALAIQAQADGVRVPGQGRFRGKIEADTVSSFG